MPVLRMIKITFTKIPVGGPKINFLIKLLISLKAKQFSKRCYWLYYLVLREGTGTAPSNVDGVLAS
jgi:hypothetical protein